MADKNKVAASCENCLHYEWDDDMEAYICNVNLDEDEQERAMRRGKRECPYFVFYDEYLSVRKQN